MSRSVFSGLSLARRGEQMEIRYPDRIHSRARAVATAQPHRLEILSAGDESWAVRHSAAEDLCPQSLKAFFADLNDFPPPHPRAGLDRAPPADPAVSCVVIVNENALFVREQLIPSLLAHSSRFPTEIVLVYNGAAAEDPALKAFRSVRSQWGAVSAAYNAGARAARGQFLALFHDDCIIDDPRWIDKCTAALARGTDVVAGEYRQMDNVAGVAVPGLPVAKCVPLFIRRNDFLEAGGFDEFHYVGYEDLDLTLALAQGGKKLAAADIRLRHFNGMSSTLKYCPVPGLAQLYAMTALPRGAVRQRFSEFAQNGLQVDGVNCLQLAMDAQLLYVLKKHRAYLAGIDGRAYASAGAALEQRLTQACPFDATLVLPRFKELDLALRRPAERAPA